MSKVPALSRTKIAGTTPVAGAALIAPNSVHSILNFKCRANPGRDGFPCSQRPSWEAQSSVQQFSPKWKKLCRSRERGHRDLTVTHYRTFLRPVARHGGREEQSMPRCSRHSEAGVPKTVRRVPSD
jgi:hypothetical protein